MSQAEPQTQEGQQTQEGLAIARIAIAGFVCLFVAAVLMWLGYGSQIFVDMLIFAKNCF